MKDYTVAEFSVQGKEYAPGVLKIDEGRSQLELLYRKKSFRKEQLVSIIKFTYDVKTNARIDETTLQVAGLSVRAETQKAASELFQLLLAPLRQAYEKTLAELKYPIRGFLLLRAEALGTVDYLKSDPRSSVIQNRTLITTETSDPVKALLEALMGKMRESLQEVERVLSTAPERVRARLSETTYALTSALCAIQDARLGSDTERGRAAAQLISSITQLQVVRVSTGSAVPTPVARASVSTEVAGRFLDGVLASLKDKMLAEPVR